MRLPSRSRTTQNLSSWMNRQQDWDPVVRSELLDMLQEIVMEDEVSVLFSTHITTDLERIADYITFINDGEIIFTGEKKT